MKWSGWIVGSLLLLAAVATAAEPRLSSPKLLQARVVSARLETAEQPVTPQAPVHYRQATWDIWNGYAGYVYSPGACDCRPPCIDGLWDGYEQRPHRCNPVSMHYRGGHCGHCGHGGHGGGCMSCGNALSCAAPSCAAAPTCAAAPSCGCEGHTCFLKRSHAWHFGGKRWSCASCDTMAPSCAAPSCAAPTCAAPSCGYAGKGLYDVPVTAADGPPQPMPEASDSAPKAEAPAPTPEEASRSNRLRGFKIQDGSLR